MRLSAGHLAVDRVGDAVDSDARGDRRCLVQPVAERQGERARGSAILRKRYARRCARALARRCLTDGDCAPSCVVHWIVVRVEQLDGGGERSAVADPADRARDGRDRRVVAADRLVVGRTEFRQLALNCSSQPAANCVGNRRSRARHPDALRCPLALPTLWIAVTLGGVVSRHARTTHPLLIGTSALSTAASRADATKK